MPRGRPKLPFRHHMLGVRIRKDDMRDLKKVARTRKLPVADFVRNMIRDWLDNNFVK